MAGTVAVACKLPHGLQLRLQKKGTRPEPVMGGGVRDAITYEAYGPTVTLNGVATEFGKSNKAIVMNGYAITMVDKDFWDAWFKQNDGLLDVLTNKLVFAHEKKDSVEGMTKDHRSARSGLEPMDMTMGMVGGRMTALDPRIPRGRVNIETADEGNKPQPVQAL